MVQSQKYVFFEELKFITYLFLRTLPGCMCTQLNSPTLPNKVSTISPHSFQPYDKLLALNHYI